MSRLNILICGGGCAGPALGFWLAKGGHKVTIVERFPALRATGAQIDLRSQGIEVAKRMGLLETIRSKLVDEAGVAIIDSHGNVKGTIMANRSGQGRQGPTSEYEIMRGDLVRILYDATKGQVEYVFGITVESFEQDDKQVVARFSDGSSGTFDMLVGADGQGSRVRRAILSPAAPEPYRRLGIHMAYYFIPREPGDTNIRRTYHSPGGRMIFRRTHNDTETQVYLILRDDDPQLSSIPKTSIHQQKEFWTERFKGAGWQTERFLKGMQTTENFYSQEVVQVCTNTWSKGRVVLIGDAAHCPSPFSGMGTSASLVGAYVLAGEINRHPDDLSQAFSNYDHKLRPFVEEVQKLKPTLLRLAIPETQWGIAILHFIVGLICFLRIPELLPRWNREDKDGWNLPLYH
ncbi:FAD/NAD(P)-binding domain-containing protein [Aaosphaeria arxii CBS 175.79]|uniref:FAD/NAD(P)-binding domain-containing protein n=1 Tax=Aaosphaeria arxii CBS 175.79 TaxID=1450172 RepID=A0A6A5XZX1_9PLEO|nr:FAD/NAD(P)-binding domain-containing protein [Aaosphaeria arxii CBS 175.79]KAF2018473.1 FAD/NAD(P)-binding domain-containing protein [Aaosphaeria arxii CBS 175.79]